jgi:hypothetical protein
MGVCLGTFYRMEREWGRREVKGQWFPAVELH